jgi:hypothetical protein
MLPDGEECAGRQVLPVSCRLRRGTGALARGRAWRPAQRLKVARQRSRLCAELAGKMSPPGEGDRVLGCGTAVCTLHGFFVTLPMPGSTSIPAM